MSMLTIIKLKNIETAHLSDEKEEKTRKMKIFMIEGKQDKKLMIY